MAKTSVRWKYADSVWPVVESWAAEHNYQLETTRESTRQYLRKSDDPNVKIRVAISQVDADVQIDTWFRDLIRAELALDSSSLYAALPRKTALSEVQTLLVQLGYVSPAKAKATDPQKLAFNLGRSIRKLTGKK
jgi:hypothetical protein